MRETIFKEMKRKNMAKDFVWVFNEYNVFYNELNPLQKEKFISTMSQLVQEGIFLEEKRGSMVVYRLTEKGEKEIYK